MKTQLKLPCLTLLISAACLAACGQSETAFTYQGRLTGPGGANASGSYDMTFTLFDTNSGGNVIAGPVTNSPVAVTNEGLFTTTVDFGNVFDGGPRWLEIGVRTNGSAVAFTVLSPRQQVTPAPYALNAAMLANGVALGSGGGDSVSPTLAPGSFIGGGSNNLIYSELSFIGGGNGNSIGREYTDGLIVGGAFNVVNANYAVVVGGYANLTMGPFSTIGGGSNNIATGPYATVGGGEGNTASGSEATVAGGSYNRASGDDSFVGGGLTNSATGQNSTVSGGHLNYATGYFATVGGGESDTSSGESATVSGGDANSAAGSYATVPGGEFNSATGIGSFAAGVGAEAMNNYSFVWADGEGPFTSISSDRDNQFKVQAAGGMVLDVSGSSGVNPAALFINSTSANGVGLYVLQTNSSDAAIVINTDATLPEGVGDLIKGFGWSQPQGFGSPNTVVFEVTAYGDVTAHSFNSTSDRNAKENFAEISPEKILAKVASIPISQWNFKGQHRDVEHIGPMAQDFHAAFGLNGGDDKHINMTDEGGVALAAIQGLNQKVESDDQSLVNRLQQRDAEIDALKQQTETLKRELDALRQTIMANSKKN